MSAVITEYASFSEAIRAIDEKISSLKQQLALLLKRFEDVRTRAEQEKKLRELLKALAGVEIPSSQSRVLDMKDFKIVVNPDATYESSVLEEALTRINKAIATLQTVRKTIEPLAGIDAGARITLVYQDDVPQVVLVKY